MTTRSLHLLSPKISGGGRRESIKARKQRILANKTAGTVLYTVLRWYMPGGAANAVRDVCCRAGMWSADRRHAAKRCAWGCTGKCVKELCGGSCAGECARGMCGVNVRGAKMRGIFFRRSVSAMPPPISCSLPSHKTIDVKVQLYLHSLCLGNE